MGGIIALVTGASAGRAGEVRSRRQAPNERDHMSEASMLELVHAALSEFGITDEVIAVGQFNPRGHTGGLFVGGLTGSSAGERLGGAIGGSIGLGAGSLAGMRANDAASGLPKNMLVAVSATRIYGLDAPTRRAQPRAVIFDLARDEVDIKVHQRVNVRILELIGRASGDTVELEGNRLPVTHSGDVIKALTD
jgi:hypothetical protein